MIKKIISAKELLKKLVKLNRYIISKNLADVEFSYTVTEYYVTFKMSREAFDDLNKYVDSVND